MRPKSRGQKCVKSGMEIRTQKISDETDPLFVKETEALRRPIIFSLFPIQSGSICSPGPHLCPIREAGGTSLIRHTHSAYGVLRNNPAPGPTGISSASQRRRNKDQPTKNVMVYGSIVAIMVPIPESFWYFWAKATISAK